MSNRTEHTSTPDNRDDQNVNPNHSQIALFHTLSSEIDEHKEGVKKVSSERSKILLGIAKTVPDCKSFLAVCEECETWIQSDLAGSAKVKTIHRAWTQAKSNIKASYEAGLDPNDFDTESALRKAKTEVNKAKAKAEAEAEPAPEQDDITRGLTLLHNLLREMDKDTATDMLADFIQQAATKEPQEPSESEHVINGEYETVLDDDMGESDDEVVKQIAG